MLGLRKFVPIFASLGSEYHCCSAGVYRVHSQFPVPATSAFGSLESRNRFEYAFAKVQTIAETVRVSLSLAQLVFNLIFDLQTPKLMSRALARLGSTPQSPLRVG